jgi:hypothetical protein
VNLLPTRIETMPIDYEGRVFHSISNSSNGEVSSATHFHYHQQERVVWAAYGGGEIALGTLIAKVNEDDSLDMRYQHLNVRGEFMSGECHSTPEVLPDGRICLHEKWQWTTGDRSSGESVIEEVRS